MRQFFRILFEGAAQAWGQLLSNKLRSFLSLLGITIGIFCIIGVKSAVNSLEDNIRSSMAKLGNDVIYIDKFPGVKIPAKTTGSGCAGPILPSTNMRHCANG